MPTEDKTVTVTVDRTPGGAAGIEAGYRASIQPWLVRPDDDDNELGKITWEFEALNNLEFGEITLNFKTKKHFDPIDTDGSDFVLKDTSPPSPNKTIVGGLDDTFNFVKKNYNYIVEFTLVDSASGDAEEIEIEIDPGYRVRP